MAETGFIFWFFFVALKTAVHSAPHTGSEVCEDWKLPRMKDTEKYVRVRDSNPIYLWIYAEEASATTELLICCNGDEWQSKNITLKEAYLYYLATFDTERGHFSLAGETMETMTEASGIWLNSSSISYLKCSVNNYLPEKPVDGKDIRAKKRIKKRANTWMIIAFVSMGLLLVVFFALGVTCVLLWRRKDEGQRVVTTPNRPKSPQGQEAAHIYDEWNPSWNKTGEEHDSENSNYGE
ncbi:uncharacterized protein LOC119570837 [Penaeus monodon]|uniref:uncharacterized protein LOC119570837 n=1 Tax=Penaeus monodon TaxID=6687 RepID=UPI0018A70798|nr:uncharacterized protein LOC119570837 [Penaeus monodon]